MKTISIKILAIVVTLFAVGCNDETLDNPGEVKVVFKAESSGIAIKSAENTAATLTFNEAFIGVNEIELELESEYVDEETGVEYERSFELEAPGPYEVDLLSGVSDPEIIISSIEPGMYAEFEFTVENTMSDGNSVYIAGVAANNGTEYPFIFSTDEEFEIEIEGKGIFEQPVEYNDLWLIYIDLDYLLADLDYDNALLNENGVIVINPEQNTELYGIVIKRLNTSFEFDEDYDDHDDEDDD